MTPITMGLSRELAEVYDAAFDRFDQNETAFVHAAVRVITYFTESVEDEQKEEIQNLLSHYFCTDDCSQESEDIEEPEELLEREALIDPVTLRWLTRAVECHRRHGDTETDIESVFMTGVLTLSVMLDVVERNPNARLSTLPVTIPISQIIYGRPQSYN